MTEIFEELSELKVIVENIVIGFIFITIPLMIIWGYAENYVIKNFIDSILNILFVIIGLFILLWTSHGIGKTLRKRVKDEG